MVNFSFTLSSLLGLLDILGAVGYFMLVITQITNAVKASASPLKIFLKVAELLLCPIALFFSGIVLFFNGWRLDPFFQIQQLLFHLVVMVAIIKELKQLSQSRR